MDKELPETVNLAEEIINIKRQVMGKLGHVVQFDVNVMLDLSIKRLRDNVWTFRGPLVALSLFLR